MNALSFEKRSSILTCTEKVNELLKFISKSFKILFLEYIRKDDHEDRLTAYEAYLQSILGRANRGHQTERDIVRNAEKQRKSRHEAHKRRKTFSGSIDGSEESRFLAQERARKNKSRKSPKNSQSRDFLSEGSYFDTETSSLSVLPDMATVEKARRGKRRENLIRQNSRALLSRVKSISKRPKKDKKKKTALIEGSKMTQDSNSSE